MKNSDRKRIRRMEIEDDLGIKRTKKKKFVMPIKAYKILKLCLIALIPVVYFLCSPLLLVVVLAYIALLFVTNAMEKDYNRGLKKELRTSFPKTDSILCVLLAVISVVCVCVSGVSTSQKKSMFEGMTEAQIEETVDMPEFSRSDMVWRRIGNSLKSVATLSTGTRYLFESERSFGGGRGPDGGMEGFEPPEGFSPPSGSAGEAPDMNEMLQNMPFSMVFESIIKAINTGMLAIVCVVGLASLRKLKKLDIVC